MPTPHNSRGWSWCAHAILLVGCHHFQQTPSSHWPIISLSRSSEYIDVIFKPPLSMIPNHKWCGHWLVQRLHVVRTIVASLYSPPLSTPTLSPYNIILVVVNVFDTAIVITRDVTNHASLSPANVTALFPQINTYVLAICCNIIHVIDTIKFQHRHCQYHCRPSSNIWCVLKSGWTHNNFQLWLWFGTVHSSKVSLWFHCCGALIVVVILLPTVNFDSINININSI